MVPSRGFLEDPTREQRTDSSSHLASWGAHLWRTGLTLMELLVVIAIIGVLVALLMPAMQSVRESARRTECAHRLHQLAVALQAFHSVAEGFPIGSQGTRFVHPSDRRQISWIVSLLPYIEADDTDSRFDTSYAFDSQENQPAAGTYLSILRCPSSMMIDTRPARDTGDRNRNGRWDPGDNLAFTDYGGMFGVGIPDLYPFMNGVMVYERAITAHEIVDGMSHTIIVGEDSARPLNAQSEWANGQNIFDQTGPINRTRNNELFSDHPQGVHVMLADGAVRWLDESIDTGTLLRLCTRSEGDVVNENSP